MIKVNHKNRRIAIIDPVGIKAGMNDYDTALCNCLCLSGFTVDVYSNFNHDSTTANFLNTFKNSKSGKMFSGFRIIAGYVKALFRCKKPQSDFLIFHLFDVGLLDLFGIGLGKFFGFRIILIIHDVENIDAKHLRWTRKLILKNLNYKKIVHNNFSFNALSELLSGSGMKNVFIVPHVNFVHLNKATNQTAPKELLRAAEKKYVLCFGQFKRTKGIDILIQAAVHCKTDFNIVLAGKPRDISANEIEKLIADSSADNKIIRIVRHISDEERNYLFRKASVVVLPYKKVYESGVLITAMSFAKPVIASDIPPFREMIQHGVNGIMFRSENKNSLTDELDAFFSGKYDEKKIGESAIQYMESRHSASQIASAFSVLLNA